MSFISTAEVAGYLQVTDDSKYATAVEMAEAVVAAYLGTDSLLEEDVTETVVLPRQKNSVELSYGPIDSIDSVTGIDLDGTAEDLDDWRLFTHWGLRRASEVSGGASVEVSYTKGWHEDGSAEDSNLPELIRKAIIRLAASRSKRPDAELKSERIGDYAYTLADAAGGETEMRLPHDIELLLQRWRRQ